MYCAHGAKICFPYDPLILNSLKILKWRKWSNSKLYREVFVIMSQE